MSRLFALLIALPLVAAVPALAASPTEEIIYRTNLGRADDVKLLLSQGVSANEVNSSGVPLLALAAGRTDAESLHIVKALLDAGADINKTDARGQTALFYAAKSGNKAVMEYLLEKNITYTSADKNGNTARNVAFQYSHNELVELLDDFVRGKNDDIRKQYEEANQQLEERYRVYNNNVMRAQEQADAAAGDRTAKAQLAARMRQQVYDISFSSCAFGYWAFSETSGQPTELGKKGLVGNIIAQRDRANMLATQFMKDYGASKMMVEKIGKTSAMQIAQQLYEMQTLAKRREQGVGTLDDMNARCGAIAGKWLADK